MDPEQVRAQQEAKREREAKEREEKERKERQERERREHERREDERRFQELRAARAAAQERVQAQERLKEDQRMSEALGEKIRQYREKLQTTQDQGISDVGRKIEERQDREKQREKFEERDDEKGRRNTKSQREVNGLETRTSTNAPGEGQEKNARQGPNTTTAQMDAVRRQHEDLSRDVNIEEHKLSAQAGLTPDMKNQENLDRLRLLKKALNEFHFNRE